MPVMTPSLSALNRTPSSSASVSACDFTGGTTELPQRLHGHCREISTATLAGVVCTLPLSSKARLMIVVEPSPSGVHWNVQFCRLPATGLAGDQLTPPFTETSTLASA